MKRLHALLLFALTAPFLQAASCAHVQPVINAVVTCSGETIPIALVDEVYTDIATENWGDLAMNAVPALKAGWDDIACIYDALKAGHPELVPHMNKLRAQHMELRVALRSPEQSGQGVLSATSDGKLALFSSVDGSQVRFDGSLPGDSLVLNPIRIDIRLGTDAENPAACGDGMHSLSLFFPGTVCVRDGLSRAEVMRVVRTHCADMGGCEVGYPGDSPWSGALIEAAHAKTKPAPQWDRSTLEPL